MRERNYAFNDPEFFTLAFTSLQTADAEIIEFADKTIRLALAGYFMSFQAENLLEKRNWAYIHENFSYKRVYSRVKELKPYETIIGKIPPFFDAKIAAQRGVPYGFIDID